jgi:hypothetical protein
MRMAMMRHHMMPHPEMVVSQGQRGGMVLVGEMVKR